VYRRRVRIAARKIRSRSKRLFAATACYWNGTARPVKPSGPFVGRTSGHPPSVLRRLPFPLRRLHTGDRSFLQITLVEGDIYEGTDDSTAKVRKRLVQIAPTVTTEPLSLSCCRLPAVASIARGSLTIGSATTFEDIRRIEFENIEAVVRDNRERLMR
jgi:hypothetical protein